MKIAQTMEVQNDQLIVKKTFDANPTLDRVRQMREIDQPTGSDYKIIGEIPMFVYLTWAKKHGVSPDDHAAMREVMVREMNNSDNAHLRVWKGRL